MTSIQIFGEALIDLIQIEGQYQNLNPVYQACPGGSPFNAALALARLGHEAHFATPISTDGYGQLLLNRLIEMGGTYAYPERVKSPTSLAVITLNKGQASYQFYRTHVADRAIDFAKLRALPLPTWLQIGGLALASKADAQAWLDRVTWLTDQGVYLSFDPNVRATFIEDRAHHRQICDALAARAHVVKLSDEDGAFLYGTVNPLDHLLAQGAGLVALTKGAKGAELATKDTQISVPVPKGNISGDTVGAGDTFGAALLSCVIRGETDLKRMGTFAATAAFLNCQHEGCHPPTRAETLEALAAA